MNQNGLVIFDLDGTILQSVEAVWLATRDLLEAVGVPWRHLPDLTEFLSVLRLSSDEFYRSYGLATPARLLDEGLADFLEVYRGLISPEPSAVQVLGELRRRGLSVALVSAAPAAHVDLELKRFDLRRFFDVLYCGQTGRKVAALVECCARFDLPPREVYFVGDMTSDMRDGQDAGVKTVGFAADFPFMRPVLTAAGAEVCIDELGELLGLELTAPG